jgi:hypothetical protein
MMGAIQNVGMPGEAEVSSRLQWTAIVLRAAFIGLLMVLILRVSQPQSETVWSAYETTGDMVRFWDWVPACGRGSRSSAFPKMRTHIESGLTSV